MKRISTYIGLAFAACLACFSMGVMAEPVASGYAYARTMLSMSEPQGVSMQRLELTLAQWRSQAQSGNALSRSDMRAASNGFVFNGLPVLTAAPEYSNT